MDSSEARNKEVVENYWYAHFERDWETMATFFTDDCHYTDVGMDPTHRRPGQHGDLGTYGTLDVPYRRGHRPSVRDRDGSS